MAIFWRNNWKSWYEDDRQTFVKKEELDSLAKTYGFSSIGLAPDGLKWEVGFNNFLITHRSSLKKFCKNEFDAWVHDVIKNKEKIIKEVAVIRAAADTYTTVIEKRIEQESMFRVHTEGFTVQYDEATFGKITIIIAKEFNTNKVQMLMCEFLIGADGKLLNISTKKPSDLDMEMDLVLCNIYGLAF